MILLVSLRFLKIWIRWSTRHSEHGNVDLSSIFSRSRVAGPRGRGPSLRAFLLLAALCSRLFSCCVVQLAPLLIVCCAMFFLKTAHVVPFGIIFASSFLSLWLPSSAHEKVALLFLLSSFCTAKACGGWGRVLRTQPPLLFFGRGVPQFELRI